MNVSSSKVSDLLQCSMAFYLKHVLRLPDKPHWKTLVGSAVHNVVEYVLKPKRRALLDSILKDGFSFAAHPPLDRYCRMWKDHYKLDLWDHQNVEDMLKLAFETLKPYLGEGQFKSEQRFELKIDGAVISGFVDVAAVGEHKRILDMKTKGQKFVKAELPENIQAAIYQMWYYEQFGELVPVDFIMLRHPPTKRLPQGHLQTVNPLTTTHIEGLKSYLVHLYYVMNNFGAEEAESNFCADEGFCLRVCPFRRPFDYISIKKKTGELVGNYFLDLAPQVKDDEVSSTLTFKGCKRWNY